jgi:hypothetical protein
MNDWIRLLVKYKGKCSVCGKEITAGEYALWSKNTKTIKHIECKTPTQITEKAMVDGNVLLRPAVPDVDCFICGRQVAFTDCGFEGDYDRKAISQACICNTCLEDKNAYQNYKQAFVKRAHRIAKIAIY